MQSHIRVRGVTEGRDDLPTASSASSAPTSWSTFSTDADPDDALDEYGRRRTGGAPPPGLLDFGDCLVESLGHEPGSQRRVLIIGGALAFIGAAVLLLFTERVTATTHAIGVVFIVSGCMVIVYALGISRWAVHWGVRALVAGGCSALAARLAGVSTNVSISSAAAAPSVRVAPVSVRPALPSVVEIPKPNSQAIGMPSSLSSTAKVASSSSGALSPRGPLWFSIGGAPALSSAAVAASSKESHQNCGSNPNATHPIAVSDEHRTAAGSEDDSASGVRQLDDVPLIFPSARQRGDDEDTEFL
jgi:hypothetical protein